jgi:hypothetical protein
LIWLIEQQYDIKNPVHVGKRQVNVKLKSVDEYTASEPGCSYDDIISKTWAETLLTKYVGVTVSPQELIGSRLPYRVVY